MEQNTGKTDFGFEQVPWSEKARRVRGVFDSVAGNYDLMNDLMSAGTHRLWKRFTLSCTNLRPGQRALDVAGGTGDLSLGMLQQVGEQGLVVLTDINHEMLRRGRDRLINAGHVGNSRVVQANAECLPFRPGYFDCVTIGFGLRNVTDKAAALRSMRSMLRPGGAAHRAGVLAAGSAGTAAALRCLLIPRAAAARKDRGQRCRQLPLPCRIHPQASRPGDAAGHDA
jgi:demethylmenaquinone methyltransferase/2-methoxy-6-polyprenyl-1,4-benzoquinol methylase